MSFTHYPQLMYKIIIYTKMISLKKALLFALIGYSWNLYAQVDTSSFKLDLGNPTFRNNTDKYFIPKGELDILSPDSILYLIDGKFYNPREINLNSLSDSAFQEFTKNIESMIIEKDQKRVDSIVSSRINRVIIIRNKKH